MEHSLREQGAWAAKMTTCIHAHRVSVALCLFTLMDIFKLRAQENYLKAVLLLLCLPHTHTHTHTHKTNKQINKNLNKRCTISEKHFKPYIKWHYCSCVRASCLTWILQSWQQKGAVAWSYRNVIPTLKTVG